jgi:hypothetical protein
MIVQIGCRRRVRGPLGATAAMQIPCSTADNREFFFFLDAAVEVFGRITNAYGNYRRAEAR